MKEIDLIRHALEPTTPDPESEEAWNQVLYSLRHPKISKYKVTDFKSDLRACCTPGNNANAKH